MIEFGEWLPDQPDYLNKGVTTALNCYPSATGYRSVKAFQAVSGAATNTIAGVFAAKENSGNVKLFAGDDTKLYVFTKFYYSNRWQPYVDATGGDTFNLTSNSEQMYNDLMSVLDEICLPDDSQANSVNSRPLFVTVSSEVRLDYVMRMCY